MTKVPVAIGIWAIIVLGSALSACATGGVNSMADDSAAPSCSPGVCVGSTPGSTPDTLQFNSNVQ
jgi:hypothetical protein